MQVSTKTTVYLDGGEIRDIVAAHLREKNTLPQDAKFEVSFSTASTTPTPCKEAKDLRIQVAWPTQTPNK